MYTHHNENVFMSNENVLGVHDCHVIYTAIKNKMDVFSTATLLHVHDTSKQDTEQFISL